MITVWSWDKCPACQQAKLFLEEAGISFQEKKLGHDYIMKDLREATGQSGIPQFSIGDKYLGDFKYVVDNIEKIKEMI